MCGASCRSCVRDRRSRCRRAVGLTVAHADAEEVVDAARGDVSRRLQRGRWHAAGATDAARSGRGAIRTHHKLSGATRPHGPQIVVRLSHAARSGRWCVRRSQAAVEAPPIQQSAASVNVPQCGSDLRCRLRQRVPKRGVDSRGARRRASRCRNHAPAWPPDPRAPCGCVQPRVQLRRARAWRRGERGGTHGICSGRCHNTREAGVVKQRSGHGRPDPGR
mmetsp:Transcript_74763/g.206195  ORF Transcript_74763/g.206195 Transcript_74763/m.206195 type:complete len:220 (+) Transcript_74763:728-1387(+)